MDANFKKECNMLVCKSNKPCVAVINTINYQCNDDDVAVQVCEIENLSNVGFDKDEIAKIKSLKVGDTISEFDFDGVVVVRLC